MEALDSIPCLGEFDLCPPSPYRCRLEGDGRDFDLIVPVAANSQYRRVPKIEAPGGESGRRLGPITEHAPYRTLP